MTILQGNSRSIAQKSGEICTGQTDLQPISFKSDRLLDHECGFAYPMRNPPEKSLRSRALEALSRREHSRTELARKLAAHTVNAQ